MSAGVYLVGGVLDNGYMSYLDRITRNPEVMTGKPCIRGLRVTVAMILRQLGAGQTTEQILADFPYLEREDVMAALQYGAMVTDEREVSVSSL